MESLRKKLGVLREAQRGLQEDIRANAQLGEEVGETAQLHTHSSVHFLNRWLLLVLLVCLAKPVVVRVKKEIKAHNYSVYIIGRYYPAS